MIYKYRGFDKISNCWVFGYPVPDKDIKGRWHIYFWDNDSVIIDDPETITADTGIKDVNGNRIFHKDIVLARNNTGEWIGMVVFYDGHFWIREIWGDSGEEAQWSLTIPCEVIGNAFDMKSVVAKKFNIPSMILSDMASLVKLCIKAEKRKK